MSLPLNTKKLFAKTKTLQCIVVTIQNQYIIN